MSWDQAARTAAIRVKPTEEWEIELIGERAWEVAFIEGARWQRKHAGEQMSKYTAEDFANARFAEHADGRLSHKTPNELWAMPNDKRVPDRVMAENGWVPVPAKPTITESEYQRLVDERGQIWTLGYRCGFLEAGGQIDPDPEPTNAERLADVYRDWCGMDEVPNSLIRFMDEAGVTAPEETK